MKVELLKTVVKGLVGGALAGFVVAIYVTAVAGEYVIHHDDYSHPVFYQDAQSRFVHTIFLSFTLAFAAIGPVIAAGSYGRWLRHATFGLVCGVALATGIVMIGSAIAHQQPFYSAKGTRADWTEFGLFYAIPCALIFGPVLGILIGNSRGRIRDETPNVPGQSSLPNCR